MLDSRVFWDVGDPEVDILRATSTADVLAALRDFWTVQVGHRFIDPEVLETAGWGVARAGHGGLDAAVRAWAGDDPDSRRLAIVAWFLWGYWRVAPRPADPATVVLVERALDVIPPDASAYAGPLFALISAVGSGRLTGSDRTRVHARLRAEAATLRATGRHAGVLPYVERLENAPGESPDRTRGTETR
jgi:hypothetical protein